MEESQWLEEDQDVQAGPGSALVQNLKHTEVSSGPACQSSWRLWAELESAKLAWYAQRMVLRLRGWELTFVGAHYVSGFALRRCTSGI